MRVVGCLLMLSGCSIALASLALLHAQGQRYAFVMAALTVEALGLWLLAQSYRGVQLAAKDKR
ncbi:hypothetical protein SAMN05421770_101927 [Granulicella rosea]|uniref:Uncharacterized protein n=1 Tax=Granulicella rosea TaxID=474952 RepID=A0A239EEK8_9BACT|nr:hypothetical protein [Granulicella rosea]SNS42871.1 hypothetical protein SAMN05421770_101927 [Granulicella rosea]